MWSKEWQGESSNAAAFPRATVVEQGNNYFVKEYLGATYIGEISVKQFLAEVAQRVNNNEPVITGTSGTSNPTYLSNGEVRCYNGTAWVTVTKKTYIAWVGKETMDAVASEKNRKKKGFGFNIMIFQQPDADKTDPKFTTGPTTQAFSAISTTMNSQSSEQQSKFKYLQSNMEQYLGIENSTMSQIIKEEENITGYTKQQSS